MKELAFIALLGGGDFACGDVVFSKGQFNFNDMICQMETHERGLCRLVDDPDPPYSVTITFSEKDGRINVLINDDTVGTCG